VSHRKSALNSQDHPFTAAKTRWRGKDVRRKPCVRLGALIQSVTVRQKMRGLLLEKSRIFFSAKACSFRISSHFSHFFQSVTFDLSRFRGRKPIALSTIIEKKLTSPHGTGKKAQIFCEIDDNT
jgi:hypothetical protein